MSNKKRRKHRGSNNHQGQAYYGKLTKSKLAYAYNLDLRTFNRWLKPHLRVIGRPYGLFYTPHQVDLIFRLLGRPDMNKLREVMK